MDVLGFYLLVSQARSVGAVKQAERRRPQLFYLPSLAMVCAMNTMGNYCICCEDTLGWGRFTKGPIRSTPETGGQVVVDDER